MTPPFGVILAGGLARRMGGGDKPLRRVAGRTLMARVMERLAPQAPVMAINANGDPARLAAFGAPVIGDGVPGHAGPLAGVLAGMDWAAAGGATHILTVAGDTPFFPADLALRLGAAVTAEAPIALAATPDPRRGLSRHPTFGLWPVALRGDLRAALGEGVRKVVLWTDRHGAATVEFPAHPYDPFFNVNTPDDIAVAETIAAEHGL
ncbi:molybdenum cofactor guanylyltransferase MobA [Pikeienuella sp. HZG-20]|uniref:molybdenum cofactor guanylyltransferase MobA n=1 Tax=Paludibacillus litoralis TaxID=3133267 RepID=UPI0030EEEB82